jgi:hypothetical protein
VEAKGNFIMNGGVITDGSDSIPLDTLESGGGVFVNGGMFMMNGGEISGNQVSASQNFGGSSGVYVGNGDKFTMNDGEISENEGQTQARKRQLLRGTEAFPRRYRPQERQLPPLQYRTPPYTKRVVCHPSSTASP